MNAKKSGGSSIWIQGRVVIKMCKKLSNCVNKGEEGHQLICLRFSFIDWGKRQLYHCVCMCVSVCNK